jgi:hypothetical protein
MFFYRVGWKYAAILAMLAIFAAPQQAVCAPELKSAEPTVHIAKNAKKNITYTIDLGTISANNFDPIKKKLLIANDADVNLVVESVVGSCPCLNAAMAKKNGDDPKKSPIITPKQRAELDIEINAAELPHGDFLRAVDVNFSNKKTLNIAIIGVFGDDAKTQIQR